MSPWNYGIRKRVMNTANRTAPKPAAAFGSGAEEFREAVEVGSAQTKQALEKMSETAAGVTTLLNDSYSTALNGAQAYNTKFVEFAQTNTKATLDFIQQLSTAKTPSEFFELSSTHSRRQFETFSEQFRQLTTLAQKAALATVERAETDVTKAYRQRS